jgi:hypothetical protein
MKPTQTTALKLPKCPEQSQLSFELVRPLKGRYKASQGIGDIPEKTYYSLPSKL